MDGGRGELKYFNFRFSIVEIGKHFGDWIEVGNGMGQAIVTFEHIGKRFFAVPVLRDINLSVEAGTVTGLVGENGAGKSTLMNLLGGVYRMEEGRMLLDGREFVPADPSAAARAGIAFIHQELNLLANLSIVDNLFIGSFPTTAGLIDRRKARSMARQMLTAVELEASPDTPVERLSPGQRQLVEIAKALGSGARIIIFDEPTSSLTAKESQRLFELIAKLRQQGKTLFYISHNLGDVLSLSDRIVILRDGAVVADGGREDFSIDSMITAMAGRKIEQMYPPRRSNPGKTALKVHGLSEPGIVGDIHLELRHGEILGLFGLMGSGRTELARILFGLDGFKAGTIEIHGKRTAINGPVMAIEIGMALVTENRRQEGLLMDLPVSENLSLAAMRRFTRVGLIDRGRIGVQVRDRVERLRIKCDPDGRWPVRILSGGNQQKVVIGKWLLTEPEILILDEPTRGVDVGAKFDIYQILQDLVARGTAVLCISSEIEELTGICDRIAVISRGRIEAEFPREAFDAERILEAAFRGHRKHA
jgi:ribose transport system ATP-binding protein